MKYLPQILSANYRLSLLNIVPAKHPKHAAFQPCKSTSLASHVVRSFTSTLFIISSKTRKSHRPRIAGHIHCFISSPPIILFCHSLSLLVNYPLVFGLCGFFFWGPCLSIIAVHLISFAFYSLHLPLPFLTFTWHNA